MKKIGSQDKSGFPVSNLPVLHRKRFFEPEQNSGGFPHSGFTPGAFVFFCNPFPARAQAAVEKHLSVQNVAVLRFFRASHAPFCPEV